MHEQMRMITGQFRDLIVDEAGRVLYDSGWNNNAIMSGARVLLASLAKGAPAAGVQYWAVGDGIPAWDQVPPAPTDRTKLQSELDRQPIPGVQIQFWNPQWQTPGQDVASANPTNVLDIRVEFSTTVEGKVLREFGLFGGNATVAKDSGLLINHKIHPPLQVPKGAKLQRRLVLTF